MVVAGYMLRNGVTGADAILTRINGICKMIWP